MKRTQRANQNTGNSGVYSSFVGLSVGIELTGTYDDSPLPSGVTFGASH